MSTAKPHRSIYLYVVGLLGLLCWAGNLNRLSAGDPSAAKWGWITWSIAALPTVAMFVLRDYGHPVVWARRRPGAASPRQFSLNTAQNAA